MGGIQGGVNNPSMYANTAFGAGYDSYRAAAGLGDSTNTQTVAEQQAFPYPMGGGGSSGGGGGGGSYGGGATGGSASSSGGSMSFNPP